MRSSRLVAETELVPALPCPSTAFAIPIWSIPTDSLGKNHVAVVVQHKFPSKRSTVQLQCGMVSPQYICGLAVLGGIYRTDQLSGRSWRR